MPAQRLEARLGLALCAAAFLALAAPGLRRPIEKWEAQNFSAAERLARTGSLGGPEQLDLILIHPPAWCYAMAASFKLFGIGDAQSKLPGLLAVLLTAAALFRLGRAALKDERKAALACAIYLLNPLVIQGALSNDFTDGTLLPLALVGFFLLWFETSGWKSGRRILALGTLYAACLWTKLTTPLGLVPALMLFSAWRKRRIDAREQTELAAIGLWGAGLFALTWRLFCVRLSAQSGAAATALAMRPLRFIANAGGGTYSVAGVPWRDYAVLWVRAVLWFGPLLLGLAAIAILRRIADVSRGARAEERDALVIFAVMVLAVYTVMQGGAGAFPKYFIEAVPFLAIFAAEELQFDPSTGLLLAACLGYYFLVVGDPLKVLNHGLRACAVDGDCRAQAFALILKLVLFALPVAAALVAPQARFRRARLCAILLAAQTAQGLLQATSPYFVRYLYGSSIADFRGAVAAMRALPAPRSALAPGAFLYLAQAQGQRCEDDGGNVWEHPDALARCVAKEKPQILVYGLPENTVGQVVALSRDPALKTALEKDYREESVGEWKMWVRR